MGFTARDKLSHRSTGRFAAADFARRVGYQRASLRRVLGGGLHPQCHFSFPKAGARGQWWGGPGPRGTPSSRSFFEESGACHHRRAGQGAVSGPGKRTRGSAPPIMQVCARGKLSRIGLQPDRGVSFAHRTSSPLTTGWRPPAKLLILDCLSAVSLAWLPVRWLVSLQTARRVGPR